MTHSDDFLRDVLGRVKTIACIGASPNPARPSHYVSQYLRQKGYRVIPVNPGHGGKHLFGEVVVPDIASLPDGVDMIDVFRRSDAVAEVVGAAIERFPDLDVLWTQIGVRDDAAAARAEAAGVTVIQDRCPKIEYARLIG